MDMNSKFRIGDRVRILLNIGRRKGKLGTVCKILEATQGYDDENIGVNHDDSIGTHDCDGCCQNGHGWYYKPDEITLVTVDNWEDELK
jgi:hypothetical protein